MARYVAAGCGGVVCGASQAKRTNRGGTHDTVGNQRTLALETAYRPARRHAELPVLLDAETELPQPVLQPPYERPA